MDGTPNICLARRRTSCSALLSERGDRGAVGGGAKNHGVVDAIKSGDLVRSASGAGEEEQRPRRTKSAHIFWEVFSFAN